MNTNQHNFKYERIGKIAIALELCPYENENILLGDQNGHWMKYLWHRMLSEVSRPSDLLKNKLSVLTFNYDRSLEHYLYT